MRVLAAFGSRPRSASRSVSRASAASAWLRDQHITTRSSANRTSTPSPSSHARSSRCRYTLHMTGLITPPCAAPVSGRRTCPQHRAQQLQDRLVTDAFLYRLHQLFVRNRGKAACDVRLDHPPAALRALIDEHLQGILLRPLRAEPETARQEARLEDRLKHDLHRGRHDPVTDRRNGQRPLLARRRTRLGNIDPARGQRTVAALPQLAGQLTEQPVYPVLLDASQSDLVD